MAEAKPKILIGEDDLEKADMRNSNFRVQGYDRLQAPRFIHWDV